MPVMPALTSVKNMQPWEWIIAESALKRAVHAPKLVKKWLRRSKKRLTYIARSEDVPISKIL
jgi:predicted GIY-YIG superfamily endonuclease